MVFSNQSYAHITRDRDEGLAFPMPVKAGDGSSTAQTLVSKIASASSKLTTRRKSLTSGEGLGSSSSFGTQRKQPIKGNHHIELHQASESTHAADEHSSFRHRTSRESPSQCARPRKPRGASRSSSPAGNLNRQTSSSQYCRTPSPHARRSSPRASPNPHATSCKLKHGFSIRSSVSAFSNTERKSPVPMTARLSGRGLHSSDTESVFRTSSPMIDSARRQNRASQSNFNRSKSPKTSVVGNPKQAFHSRRFVVSSASRGGQTVAGGKLNLSRRRRVSLTEATGRRASDFSPTESIQARDSQELEFVGFKQSPAVEDSNSIGSDSELSLVDRCVQNESASVLGSRCEQRRPSSSRTNRKSRNNAQVETARHRIQANKENRKCGNASIASSPGVVSGRGRSSSWDSPEHEKVHNKYRHEKQQEPIQHLPKEHVDDGRQTNVVKVEDKLLKALAAGVTLEDIFALERVLHTYKEELLRRRIYSSEDSKHKHELRRSFSQEQGSQILCEVIGSPEDAERGPSVHPTERCQSGNCFMDESDDYIVGNMEFEECEPSLQYQNQDQASSGARAPNFKMFMSNGKWNKSSDESTYGTKESCPLSKSPGNISFINRLARVVDNNPLKQKSPHPNRAVKAVHKVLKDSCCESDEITDTLEFSGSPRSAFSRANGLRC